MADESYDAGVVGSRFGGSINALRLAQAGKSVLVLERGARYLPDQAAFAQRLSAMMQKGLGE